MMMLGCLIYGLMAVAVGSVHGSSQVNQITSRYSCCDRIKFDGSCENLWSMKGQNFAHYRLDGQIKECMFPCKTIKDGCITMEACVNFTKATFCTNAMGITKETRTNYLSQTCEHHLSNWTSPGVQGSLVLMLLVPIGLILLCI